MRYVSGTLVPEDGGMNPTERAIDTEPSLSREVVYNLSLFTDDDAAILNRLQGDADALRQLLSNRPEIIAFTISESDDGIYGHTHFEPNDLIRDVFTIIERHGLFIDYPIEYTEQEGLQVTLVGTDETLRQAIQEFPDAITDHIHSTGEYQPEDRRLVDKLTDRQYQVVQTAVNLGYYHVPRGATCTEIAEELGVSVNTVSQHLRKAHAALLPALFPE